jgi:hypothetical protein
MIVQPARTFTRKLITACLAACLLPIALPMLPATAAPGYKPPSRKSAKRTEATGQRNDIRRIGTLANCARDMTIPMTMVMPNDLAHTSLAKPPLFLYLEKPKQVMMGFYEVSASGSHKRLWEDNFMIDQQGIVQVAYPENQPELEVGKTYAWIAAIVCNPEDPNQNTSKVETMLTRVAPSRWLQKTIDSAITPRKKADLYASSGFWIDTLVATSDALASGTDRNAEQDLLALLEQVDLKAIAQQERANSVTPDTKPAAVPSPAAMIPTPALQPTAAPKPADPKKPCH